MTKWLMTLHREWVVETTNPEHNEDTVFRASVDEMLDIDLRDQVDVLRLDEDEASTYEPDLKLDD